MSHAASSKLSKRVLATCALALVVRPHLWPTALRFLLRAAPARWWRQAPFIPIPDASYVEFRYSTAYGHNGKPTAREFVAYLNWCANYGL